MLERYEVQCFDDHVKIARNPEHIYTAKKHTIGRFKLADKLVRYSTVRTCAFLFCNVTVKTAKTHVPPKKKIASAENITIEALNSVY